MNMNYSFQRLLAMFQSNTDNDITLSKWYANYQIRPQCREVLQSRRNYNLLYIYILTKIFCENLIIIHYF